MTPESIITVAINIIIITSIITVIQIISLYWRCVKQITLWWWTTFTASDIKARVEYLPGIEYLFARVTPDQLDLPDFVLKYDYEVRPASSFL